MTRAGSTIDRQQQQVRAKAQKNKKNIKHGHTRQVRQAARQSSGLHIHAYNSSCTAAAAHFIATQFLILATEFLDRRDG